MACKGPINTIRQSVAEYVDSKIGDQVYVVNEAWTKQKKAHPHARGLLVLANAHLPARDPDGGTFYGSGQQERFKFVQQYQVVIDAYLVVVTEGADDEPAWELEHELRQLLSGFVDFHQTLPNGWTVQAPGMWMRESAPVKDPEPGFYELGMRFVCNLEYCN